MGLTDASAYVAGRRPTNREGRGHQVTATSAPETVVEVTNLTAGYLPGVNILNECSTSSPRKGELIGIIGPNGAGKSTLLKAIFGQVKIRGGEILLNGDDITGLKANKLVVPRRRLRAAEQQRLPVPDDRGEPADGALPEPEDLRRAPRVRHRDLRRARQAAQAARRLAVRRRAPDGGDVARADDGPARAAARRAVAPASPRCARTRRSSGSPRSTRPA